jgi:peptidoglycan/LPS O-acetylase OafA/YrhL
MSEAKQDSHQTSTEIRRRYDLDWLRVFGMGVVILVHCARYFDKYGWHVENQTSVPFLTYFVNWAGQWVMPMFMLLAGMGSWYSLRSRDWKAYLMERWLRLVPPFIFGVLVLSPPQIFVERLTHGQFVGSFWSFLPSYFEGWYGFGGNFAWMGLHLWFLMLLFVFAVLALPFLWRSRVKGHWPYDVWVAVVLALLLLTGSEFIVNQYPASLGRRNFGGWSPVTYLVIYFLGYGLAANPEMERMTRRIWGLGFLVGLLGSAIGFFQFGLWYEQYSVGSSIVRAFAVWGWLIGIIGFASCRLDRNKTILETLSPAVLPIYILHQPIIVGVGLLMLDSELDWWQEYTILLAASSILLIGAYRIIKRIPSIAPLFGITAKT